MLPAVTLNHLGLPVLDLARSAAEILARTRQREAPLTARVKELA